jgi:phosphoribosyl 1,2-cyclic phosphodiesterase
MIEIKALASSSRGNAYYITDGVAPLLLECGIPWKEIRQKLNFQTSGIAGCLITHEHNDHARAWQDVAKAGIDIYASQVLLKL